jgi:hypothetical protein
MSIMQRFGIVVLLLSALLLGGCNANARYRVYGSVSYKGQPITAGLITFIPEGSEASAGGAPITDGKYDIPAASGLPPGKYKVSISVPSAKVDPKEIETPGISVEAKETLPAKYNSETELRAEVTTGGTNEHNFDLK